jgi:hypothetical protein
MFMQRATVHISCEKTSMSRNRSSGTVSGSPEGTARSASLPGSTVPVWSSSNVAYALLIVHMRSAAPQPMVSSGMSVPASLS